MIQFSCRCGKQYQVGGEFAGKKVRCKGCGNVIAVPPPVGRQATAPPPPAYFAPPPPVMAPAGSTSSLRIGLIIAAVGVAAFVVVVGVVWIWLMRSPLGPRIGPRPPAVAVGPPVVTSHKTDQAPIPKAQADGGINIVSAQRPIRGASPDETEPPPEQSLPEWTPSQANLNRLSPAVNVGSYFLRIPIGFVANTAAPDRTTWTSATDPRTILTLQVMQRGSDARFPYVMTRSGRSPAGVHQVQALIPGTKEFGSVSGIPFVRGYHLRPGAMIVIYTAYIGMDWIVIKCESPDAASLDLLEAAARTFGHIHD